ncbi:MAG: arginase [Acidobacteriota bacterium]
MSREICTIGVPMDLGQARRGVDMGPSALRYAGLGDKVRELGYTVRDGGNIEIPVRDTLPEEGGLEFLPSVVAACEAIYQAGQETIAAGNLPLFLGGDHSIAAGTVGAATHHGPVGVVWIDAHGDFNTPESSPSGNIHGMPLAALTGLGHPELVNLGRPGPKVDPADVVLIGIRDLDSQERTMLRDSGAGVYTMREIDQLGIGAVAEEALRRLAHLPKIHVSLDMDSLDPREAPGVGTPVTGGLSYREAHLLMEILASEATIGSIDIVEVNPILDDRNQTATLAVDLLTSLLGKSIF